MKENWERTGSPMTLTLRQINEIIKPMFPGKPVISVERIGTGLSNANYKIQVEGSAEPYVFRMYSGNSNTANKEIAISQLVQETVPVAEFLYADTSCRTVAKPWALLEWKEGFHLRDVFSSGSEEDLASAASAVGKTLADIHAYTFPEAGFFGKELTIARKFRMDGERFLSFMEQSLFHNRSGRWLGGDLTQALWSFCQKYSPLLSASKTKPVLVHSDFNGLNILMRRGGAGVEVSAVLDWEFAFAWSRYADIGNMLRYEPDDSAFEKHFIRAYQAQGADLEHNWKLLSKLEDLVALTDMLNQSTLQTPNRMRDLQRLITATVQS